MKKIIIYFLLSLFLIILLISCFKPSPNAQHRNIITLAKTIIDKLNNAKNNSAAQIKLSKELTNNDNVIDIYKGTKFVVESNDLIESNILHAIDGNSFIIKKGAYVTFDKNEFWVSFNNKDWYLYQFDPLNFNAINIDPDKQNFIPDYNVQYKIDEVNNIMSIMYSFAFLENKNAKLEKLKTERKVIPLKPNMVLASKDPTKLTHNLNKVILYIPENTIIKGKIFFNGNILTANNENNKIEVTFLRDMFIYIKNRIPSISFDSVNWNVNLLSFRLNIKTTTISDENSNIIFNFNVDLNYLK